MTLSPFPPRCIKLRLLQCTRRSCANLLLPFTVKTLSSHVWGKYRIPRPQLDKNSCITKIHSYLLNLQFSGLPHHYPRGEDRVNFRVHIQHVSTILLLSFFLLLPWSLFHIAKVFPFPILIFVFCFISMFSLSFSPFINFFSRLFTFLGFLPLLFTLLSNNKRVHVVIQNTTRSAIFARSYSNNKNSSFDEDFWGMSTLMVTIFM